MEHRWLPRRRGAGRHVRRAVLDLAIDVDQRTGAGHLRTDAERPILPGLLLMRSRWAIPLLLATTGCYGALRTSWPDADFSPAGSGGTGGGAGDGQAGTSGRAGGTGGGAGQAGT